MLTVSLLKILGFIQDTSYLREYAEKRIFARKGDIFSFSRLKIRFSRISVLTRVM